jgi:pentatricopeptide repeat protein
MLRFWSQVAEHFLREPWFKATVKDHNKLLDLFVKNGLFIKAENRYRQMLAKGEALEHFQGANLSEVGDMDPLSLLNQLLIGKLQVLETVGISSVAR